MAGLTDQQARAAFNQIAGARLKVMVMNGKVSATDAERLRQDFNTALAGISPTWTPASVVSAMMAPLKPGATSDTGCCTYIVNGEQVMADGITEDECKNILQGIDWQEGSC